MKLHKRWKSFVSILANYWGISLVTLGSLLIAAGILSYKIATLVPAFSPDEITTRAASKSFGAIKNNPLFGPKIALQFILQKLNHHGPLAMRSVSVLVGLTVICSFYYVLSKWYTRRIAILGTLLLATSSWFLHISRLSTNDIMFCSLFLLFACGVWLEEARRNVKALLTCGLLAIALLYIPGMIWFILPIVFWQRRRIALYLQQVSTWQLSLLIVMSSVLLVPLILSIVYQPSLYKEWLGLPVHWLSFKEMAQNLVHIPAQLFWHGPRDASRWLGQLPLIDWFGAVMFAVGAYSYWFKLHLDRTWFLIYIAIIGSVLIAIGGPVRINLFLPFVYLVMAGGVALMLQQWFTVFPRNPFARTVGTTLIIIAVMASCFYQLNHYFVAWPNAPETKAVFHQKP